MTPRGSASHKRSLRMKHQNRKKKKLPSNRPKPKKGRGRDPRRKAFDEIRLGYLMKHRAPLEFSVIMESCGRSMRPDADMIEILSYASTNRFFRTVLFRRALIDYRINGLYGEVGRHRSEQSSLNLEKQAHKRVLCGLRHGYMD